MGSLGKSHAAFVGAAGFACTNPRTRALILTKHTRFAMTHTAEVLTMAGQNYEAKSHDLTITLDNGAVIKFRDPSNNADKIRGELPDAYQADDYVKRNPEVQQRITYWDSHKAQDVGEDENG